MRTVEVRGQPLIVHDENDEFSNAIVRDKTYYEIEILEYLEKNYPTHDVIVDVGANIGNHTMFFARYLDYTGIVSIEPVVENYTLLDANRKLLDFPYIVSPLLLALGDENKVCPMYLHPRNFGAHAINEGGDYMVSVISLDSLLPRANVTLLKIDVEWFEPNVLVGAKDTIERSKPLILIEDTNNVYSDLIPDYKLIKGWPEHQTYLYGWK